MPNFTTDHQGVETLAARLEEIATFDMDKIGTPELPRPMLAGLLFNAALYLRSLRATLDELGAP